VHTALLVEDVITTGGVVPGSSAGPVRTKELLASPHLHDSADENP
jgi:hypothetical protein